jgi:hypothetical protein
VRFGQNLGRLQRGRIGLPIPPTEVDELEKPRVGLAIDPQQGLSSKASSAARRDASSMNSKRFLHCTAVARWISAGSAGLIRMLIMPLRSSSRCALA